MSTTWNMDPTRSSVEFEVPNLWGLTKVKGRFDRYDGTLDLRREPAIELTIDADSPTTENARRDKRHDIARRRAQWFDVLVHRQTVSPAPSL